jgi:hypothetical protein
MRDDLLKLLGALEEGSFRHHYGDAK